MEKLLLFAIVLFCFINYMLITDSKHMSFIFFSKRYKSELPGIIQSAGSMPEIMGATPFISTHTISPIRM